ncbi:hypothetical protein Pcac1_g5714 [Phytophthora cactorum]|nr:hypothetical protein Pcac1_g5714 [Phytophthora cactorum]KAG2968631.1 hypothetical protein PC119_g24164 [Phytophthora cactorum]
MVGTERITPDTAWVAVDESERVQEYAGVVYEASVVSETNDEDVDTIENGDVYREQ